MNETNETATQLRTEVDTILALADADRINTAYALLKVIEKATPADQPDLLQHLAEHYDAADSSKEIKIESFISENDRDLLKKRYGKLVDQMLQMILDDKPDVALFYKQLCELLHNQLLRDERARAFALYWLLIDKRMPYFQLTQGLRMSSEDFTALGKKLRVEMSRIRFILASSFEQRSEEADLLLKELDAHTGSERVRLMGYILWQLRDKDKESTLARLLK